MALPIPIKKRRTDFFALTLLTVQRSNEGSRAALAPGAVRPKEMHRLAIPERAAPDWANGQVSDTQASLTRRGRLAAPHRGLRGLQRITFTFY